MIDVAHTPEMPAPEPDAIVIGGGLSGLAAAGALHAAGRSVVVLEAGDDIGGRARTDLVDGYLLDRGFQVLLDAYPEVRRQLDLEALDLRPFEPGAAVWTGTRISRLSDPMRRPLHALESLASPVGSAADKVRILRWRQRATRGRDPYAAMVCRPEVSAAEALLEREGFSWEFVEQFLRPFWAGIFLDADLRSSSRMMDFVWRMFAEGSGTLPAGGMGSIARQLAARLPDGSIRLGASATAIEDPAVVRLESGEAVHGKAIIVATDQWTAASLLGDAIPAPRTWVGTTCVQLAAPRPPVDGGLLVLNGVGDADGPVNSVAMMSNVAATYAPRGTALISASIVGSAPGDDDEVEAAVRAQLTRWFGPDVQRLWRCLAVQRITEALPSQVPPQLTHRDWPVELAPGRYVCGDHRDTASIDGALRSGRIAGERAAEWLAPVRQPRPGRVGEPRAGRSGAPGPVR